MDVTRVKVCGFTGEADVRDAVAAGVDFVGLVFHPPSARNVSAERARTLADAARDAGLTGGVVGVFVDQPGEEIAHLVDTVGLDVVQLYGDQHPAGAARVWRALRIDDGWDVADVTARGRALAAHADAVLVDRLSADSVGGTGRGFDPSLVVELSRVTPVVMAGGLTPDTVSDVVGRVRPFAVDVSSGVEVRPGVKDAARVRAFVRATGEAR